MLFGTGSQNHVVLIQWGVGDGGSFADAAYLSLMSRASNLSEMAPSRLSFRSHKEPSILTRISPQYGATLLGGLQT